MNTIASRVFSQEGPELEVPISQTFGNECGEGILLSELFQSQSLSRVLAFFSAN